MEPADIDRAHDQFAEGSFPTEGFLEVRCGPESGVRARQKKYFTALNPSYEARFAPLPFRQLALARGKRADRFLDAAEEAIGMQHVVDVEARERLLSPHRLEAGDRDHDAVVMAFADQAAEHLGGGEIDLDHAGRLEHEQPYFFRRGAQRLAHIGAEPIG